MHPPFVPSSLRFAGQTALLTALLGVFPFWHESSRTPHGFSIVLVEEEPDPLTPITPSVTTERLERLSVPDSAPFCGGVDLLYRDRQRKLLENIWAGLAFLFATGCTIAWLVRQHRSTQRASEALVRKYL